MFIFLLSFCSDIHDKSRGKVLKVRSSAKIFSTIGFLCNFEFFHENKISITWVFYLLRNGNTITKLNKSTRVEFNSPFVLSGPRHFLLSCLCVSERRNCKRAHEWMEESKKHRRGTETLLAYYPYQSCSSAWANLVLFPVAPFL